MPYLEPPDLGPTGDATFSQYFSLLLEVENVGNLFKMKKAALASFFYVALSKTDNYPLHCPKGENNWYKFTIDLKKIKTKSLHISQAINLYYYLRK